MILKESMEGMLRGDTSEKTCCYMEFLKKSIEMYSSPEVLDYGSVHSFNLHIFLIILM